MPRIAVLADIHGNLPAFEAALEDVDALGVDEIILGGDLVGRGPQGSAVVATAMKRGFASVRGNHEDYLLSFRRREVPEDWLTADEWSCSRWMAAELDETAVDYIDRLPFTMTSTIEPRVRIFHGSPTSYNEGLGPWTSDERIRQHFDAIDENVLVCAHTHRPAVWELDDGLVVNVGSVGMPFNGDTRAQYAILDDRGGWSVEFRQVDYALDAILDVYRDSGFLDAGGATAHFLELELRTARPHLVPFLKWAEVLERRPVRAHIDEFMRFFDPSLSIAEQYRRLQDLVNER